MTAESVIMTLTKVIVPMEMRGRYTALTGEEKEALEAMKLARDFLERLGDDGK